MPDDRHAPLLRNLEGLPGDASACLLLRHSARDRIQPGETGNELPLTAEGVRMADELGRALGDRIVRLHASPVERCVQTARCLARGAGTEDDAAGTVAIDNLLGGPGVYVRDLDLVWQEFWRLGRDEFLRRVVDCGLNGAAPLPGLVPTAEAARRLVGHMLALAAGAPGLHVFVSHDVILVPTIACCLGAPLPRPDWPAFLDGALLWHDNGQVRLRYRDLEGVVALPISLPIR